MLGLNLKTAASTQTYGIRYNSHNRSFLLIEVQHLAENVKFRKYHHLEVWNASIPLLRSLLPIVINILSRSKTGLRFTLHPHQQFKHGSLLLCSINTSCLLIYGDSIKVITCHNQTWKWAVTGKARQSFDWRRWATSLAWLSYQGKDGISKLLGEAEPYWTVCKMFTARSRGSLNSESQLKLLFTTTFGLFCTEKSLDCSLQNSQNWVFSAICQKRRKRRAFEANGLLLSHCWPVWQK